MSQLDNDTAVGADLEGEIRRVEGILDRDARVEDVYPLTPLQEGILFHHVLAGGNDAYVTSCLFEFQSRTPLDSFVEALQCVIDRTEVLRTSVLWKELPRAVQVVHRRAELPVEGVQLDLNRDCVEQLSERMRLGCGSLTPQQAPMMRLLISPDPQSGRWYAILYVHHIICDGQSFQTLLEQIVAHLKRDEHALCPRTPYRDHVMRVLAASKAGDVEAFFSKKLGDVTEPTAPFGLLDVYGSGSDLEETARTLDCNLARRLRFQARRCRITTATLFHAAWGMVLARTSGRDDVVFGTVFFGHLQRSGGSQKSIGMFLNTLPLRLRLSDVGVREFVLQTQRELFELLRYEQSSLAVAQRRSGVAAGSPLFTTVFNYRHGARENENDVNAAEFGIKVLASHVRTNYPISVSVDDLGEVLVLNAQTVRHIDSGLLLGYLDAALVSLADALEKAPETPAPLLSILPDSERHRIVELFNAAATSAPLRALVYEQFEGVVQRMPDAVAMVSVGHLLSYAELNARANRLARYLRDRGVAPGQLVAICIEHSIEFVVSMLGILKAGGAYVPLDPGCPSNRLAFMIRDSSPPLLLTLEKFRNAFPVDKEVMDVVALDSVADDISRQSDRNLDALRSRPEPNELACVIYASGATGIPNGMMIEHRNLMSLVGWNRGPRALEPAYRCSSVTTAGFDAAVGEIWPALCSGDLISLAPSASDVAGEADRTAYVGRPITQGKTYILDPHCQPVAVGVAGEIFIGGAGVGRGYLNRPELTAARFLPDLLTDNPGARAYRSGDLGRWRADGTIELLGRSDVRVRSDRQVLPSPDGTTCARSGYAAPQGRIEEQLAQIWCEVLRMDRVGREDNFFELGGHSLLGMKLIAEITRAFAIQAPVNSIFQHPTIQEMAQLIGRQLSRDLRSGGLDQSQMEQGFL